MKRRHFLKGALSTAALWPAGWLLADEVGARSEIPARSLSGQGISLRAQDIEDFAAGMRGPVLVSGQQGYDDARRVWNGMFDKRPAVIARCKTPSDVARAVDFARGHQLLTAVRAGGHSVAGKSTCDGGIMIDVSPMRAVRVDSNARIAYVEGGALLGDLDRATKPFKLVTTAGTVSHTGAAGLTLGGGLGRVGRRFGLACDNLRSVAIVTADGQLLTASDRENADLFWGLRGGGGNFGVATLFEYQLHPMHPMVLAGRVTWPFAQASEVLKFYAEYSANAPDELNLDMVSFWTPEGPMISIRPCWSADLAKGERVLEPLRKFGKPVSDDVRAQDYVALQSGGDNAAGVGRRYYNKAGFVPHFTDELIAAYMAALNSSPPGSFALALQVSGGAIGRKAVDATAFPNRDANYWLMAIAGWDDPAQDQQKISSTRSAWKLIEPHTSGFYVNSMSESEYSQVAANYGANYPRLQKIKRNYDPNNQFRLNANIVPA